MSQDHTAAQISEPPFWNDQLHRIPWCVALREQASAVGEELLAFIANYRPFMPYPKYGNLYDNEWVAFPLSKFQGEYMELSKHSLEVPIQPMVDVFRSKLPITSSTIEPLERQDMLRNVFVSKLVPGSVINPHQGWTPDYLRVHLCIKDDPQCVITVGDEEQTWHVGELLAFKDGGPYLHSVRHLGQTARMVISYDLHLDYVAQFIPEVR